MKPKFRKKSIVWVQGKVFKSYLDRDETETGVTIADRFDGGQHLFINIKFIRPNVTRKQLEKWFNEWIEDDRGHILPARYEESFQELCELLGIK